MAYQSKDTGRRLRHLRKQSGYSREQVAKQIGRSSKYYADIERGTCGMSVETLIGLAELYHVSLDFLVDGVGEEAGWKDVRTEGLMREIGSMGDEERKRVIDIIAYLVERERTRNE